MVLWCYPDSITDGHADGASATDICTDKRASANLSPHGRPVQQNRPIAIHAGHRTRIEFATRDVASPHRRAM